MEGLVEEYMCCGLVLVLIQAHLFFSPGFSTVQNSSGLILGLGIV